MYRPLDGTIETWKWLHIPIRWSEGLALRHKESILTSVVYVVTSIGSMFPLCKVLSIPRTV